MNKPVIMEMRTSNFVSRPAGAGEYWLRATTHLGRFVLSQKRWPTLAGKALVPERGLSGTMAELERLSSRTLNVLEA